MNCNPNDIIGKKFGMLTVVKEVERKIKSNGRTVRQYECLCECGNSKVVTRDNLIGERITNCGNHKVLQIEKRKDTLKNKYLKEKHNEWKILCQEGIVDNHEFFKCQCDCGCNEIKFIQKNKLSVTLCEKRKEIERQKLEKQKVEFNIYDAPQGIEDLTGNVYGRLTVLGFGGVINYDRYWVCQCSCGTKKIIKEYSIISGITVSCGCYHTEKTKEFALDLVGQKIGRLTVIKRVENKDRCTVFLCKCDCGNEITVKGSVLNRKEVMSCGCVKSKGEYEIAKFLSENNIKFNTQKRFDECKYKYPLPFDFQIFYKDSDNFFLCEYQGQQHYYPTSFSYNSPELAQEKYEYTQKSDEIKKKYCQDNNIKLVEIPYWNFNKIKTILGKEFNL